MDQALIATGYTIGIGAIIWICVDMVFFFFKKAADEY